MRTSLHERAQPDEGYSEENGSQVDTDTEMFQDEQYQDAKQVITDPKVEEMVTKALLLPVNQRAVLLRTLIPTVPNPVKEEIATLIEQLTHFDPTLYLPNELVLNIFSYLAPEDLLRASRISRGWRLRALDEELWRLCFAREGWVLDRERIERFEKQYQEITQAHGPKVVEGLVGVETTTTGKGKEAEGVGIERKGSRKRGRDEAFSDGEAAGTGLDGEAGGLRRGNSSGGDGMEGIESTSTADSPRADTETDNSIVDSFSATPTRLSPAMGRSFIQPRQPTTNTPYNFKLAPTIFQAVPDNLKVSWAYLYKQRRRLEHNWEKKKCISFQLPHPDYPQEGHEECVYTVQHTATHLVSGSRDRTIRIWDLATYRLKRTPLRGHEASVLCLQFDERPEHDIIVSGGSDAFVIVWKFSTGEILKKMTRAHEESVLNLRFDDRYIVTCSKDKTIKIWNRNALPYASPLIPAHVLSQFNETMNEGDMIAEYSLLSTLLGHQAAVNAVQIHGDTIVSASGDRTIKAWSLSSPAGASFVKNYVGHTKGIACVQFDGRRIVSGSSDNTVRIFDAELQAEVACLGGHDSLVRTVQARFGDLDIITDEELAAEAKRADLEFFKAVDNGTLTPRGAAEGGEGRRTRGRNRNAGSARPEDRVSLGTKIPPGGGGSRWAKIVSGSYDESVILWKKDKDGNWIKWDVFNQRDVLNLGGRRRSQRRGGGGGTAGNNGDGGGGGGGAAPGNTSGGVLGNLAQAATAAGPSTTAQGQSQRIPDLGAIGPAAHAALFLHGNQQQGPANLPQHLPSMTQLAAMAAVQNQYPAMQLTQQQNLQQQQQQLLQNNLVNASTQTTTTTNASAGSSRTQHHHHQQQQQYLGLNPGAPSGPATAANMASPANVAAIAESAQAAANPSVVTYTPQPLPPALQQAQQAQQAAQQAQAVQQAGQHHHRATNESNRVFKLQFDARRIVCCSQNKVIVGWDFANGDVELERVGGWSLETA